MEIRARNTSGSYVTVGKVRWSEEWSGWQFAAIPIVMPEAYQAVQINIIYRNNLNEAQFSNLFLHKEEFGKTFAYDSNGNVTSVRNMASLQSYGAYDSFNNLLAYRQPGRPSTAQYTQAWGDTDAERKKHLLRTAQSPAGVIRAYTYDAKGNVLTGTTRNAAGTLAVASSAAYTADGNYVSSQTDARGKTVTIVTDANNGAITSVTDPNGQSVAYTYDGLNRRTASTASADGKTYRNTYTYTGDLLTRISHNTTADDACDVNYHFAYDAQNRPAIVAYNGTKYAYIYNLQGDVLGLIDSNGTEVVKYTYDAWSKVLSATGSLASSLGIVQPFRYRGYVFDVETGFYYVSSRYYDPEIGRFINADDIDYLGADGSPLSYNLFAYCMNNPVNRFDINDNWSMPNWLKVTVGAVAIAGLAVATVCTGGAAAVVCGAVMGAIGSGISGGWQGALDGACSGFMSGTLIGGATGAASAGMNIATGATTVVGEAHGSILHKLATNMEAGKMAASGQYSQIDMNKALKTMGLNGTNRSDVIGVAKNGINKLVEVVRPKQSTGYIVGKMSGMLSGNPGAVGKIVTWVRRLFN